MNKSILVIFALGISLSAFGQLSKGEGETVALADKKFSCYLPKYFEVQEEPPGVIHKASGSFVIAVKMPSDRAVAAQSGLSRSFFEDPRYEITAFREEKQVQSQRHRHPDRSYWMAYELQGHAFERVTVLRVHGNERYLIIGNYPVKLKGQVQEEVRKIMGSFTIH